MDALSAFECRLRSNKEAGSRTGSPARKGNARRRKTCARRETGRKPGCRGESWYSHDDQPWPNHHYNDSWA